MLIVSHQCRAGGERDDIECDYGNFNFHSKGSSAVLTYENHLYLCHNLHSFFNQSKNRNLTHVIYVGFIQRHLPILHMKTVKSVLNLCFADILKQWWLILDLFGYYSALNNHVFAFLQTRKCGRKSTAIGSKIKMS